MNDIMQNARECKYKGVSLLVDKITTTDGRTNVEYLLANTDRRVIKDGGAFPPSFAIIGTLHSTGQNWQEFTGRVDQLRSVLNSPLPGEFVHPIHGPFFCKHGQYTLEHDIRKTGRCDYKITLKQCDRNGNPLTPTGQLFSKPQVKKLALEANRKLQDASALAMTHLNPANKPNTKSFLGNISDKMSGSFASLGDNISKATAFTEKAFKIKDQAAFYADNPKMLFAAIADSLLGVDGLTVDVFIKLKKIQDLFEFDGEDTSTSFGPVATRRVPETPQTRDEAERTNNADLMRNFMQAGGLVEYMGYTSDMEPETTDDIDQSLGEMSEAYNTIRQRLIEDVSDDSNVFYRRPDYSESLDAIEAVYSAADGYLRQRRETTPNIRTINVAPMPVDVLSYLLYETSERSDEIMSLNGFTDPSVVSGEVLVLSS